jgi:hypothetical protein
METSYAMWTVGIVDISVNRLYVLQFSDSHHERNITDVALPCGIVFRYHTGAFGFLIDMPMQCCYRLKDLQACLLLTLKRISTIVVLPVFVNLQLIFRFKQLDWRTLTTWNIFALTMCRKMLLHPYSR